MSQTINAWADKYAVGPAALEALYATLSNTPAARWRENGGGDPFGIRYGCERAALAMGHLTDDELANAVYLHGDERPRLDKMLSKDYVSPSAYLLAAKDRIRWLSRKLVEAEQLAISAEDANTQLTAEKDARGRSGYTSAMGEAAEKYHGSFEHAHPLPAQWRWEDVWAAMSRAAANPIGEYVDPVKRHADALAHARALAARQPGAEEPVSPMAKMAAALREKAAIEHTEYSQRVQSGEWGPMPEAGTQADFCRYCEGSGWGGESRKTKCPACSGTGMPVPPAQAVDLRQFRDAVADWRDRCCRAADKDTILNMAKADRLLTLIDSHQNWGKVGVIR